MTMRYGVLAPLLIVCALAGCAHTPRLPVSADQSVARQWNEALLEAIRNDYARPTVHARNLYHTSVAMWDAWAAYDETAQQVIHHERASAANRRAAREQAISYAAYRLLRHRFAHSPGKRRSLRTFDALMERLGYDRRNGGTTGDSPAALGNRVAASVIEYGLNDGANEANRYANRHYWPVNPPIEPKYPGNPYVVDPNRWQMISLDVFVDQSGNPVAGGTPEFVSPEWGFVEPFALTADDRRVYEDADGNEYWVYHDPGPPPRLGEDDEAFKTTFVRVVECSSYLDPTMPGLGGESIDISPASRGDNTFGTNDGDGHALNPHTGEPYTPHRVPAGDYFRAIAEFWADGPDSETPPGHWFTIANYVSDQAELEQRIGGVGPVVDDLEWDVKLYLTLGGAMHDAAVSAWSIKGWYDYVRPISAIRYMAGLGQSSDPRLPRYHPHGILLVPGLVELITEETVRSGGRHAHLADRNDRNVGKIALFAWRGPDHIRNPEWDEAGVGWILAENWWPYQRPTFVTPPFAGYVSGHSTYSRAAAVVLTRFTGDPFFPGGLGVFPAPRNEFLVFEEGPSVDVNLQWATYYDAADETSISRIYGGIHPPADDIPGRFIGDEVGNDAFDKAMAYISGS